MLPGGSPSRLDRSWCSPESDLHVQITTHGLVWISTHKQKSYLSYIYIYIHIYIKHHWLKRAESERPEGVRIIMSGGFNGYSVGKNIRP